MARAIDGDALKRWCEKIIDQACHPATVQIGGVFLAKVRSMPTLTPPNEALTLEQLREMDGEPVWVSYPNRIGEDRWYVIEKSTEAGLHVESHPHFYLGWDTYGKFWLAYRRPPEGEEHCYG